jgi:hypothetical protein
MTVSSRSLRRVLVLSAVALGVPLTACTGAGVYVGVSAPGPWVGYPPGYIGYPGYVGYPGWRYEEEEEQDAQEAPESTTEDEGPASPGSVQSPDTGPAR